MCWQQRDGVVYYSWFKLGPLASVNGNMNSDNLHMRRIYRKITSSWQPALIYLQYLWECNDGHRYTKDLGLLVTNFFYLRLQFCPFLIVTLYLAYCMYIENSYTGKIMYSKTQLVRSRFIHFSMLSVMQNGLITTILADKVDGLVRLSATSQEYRSQTRSFC